MTELIKGIIPVISNLLLALGNFILHRKLDRTEWKVPQRKDPAN
ncbi:hypothetical protein [Paenibacillus sp. FJAT-26967]|nr:hypothetical protein [Paenibacillus sp. FJAT-26967]